MPKKNLHNTQEVIIQGTWDGELIWRRKTSGEQVLDIIKRNKENHERKNKHIPVA